MGHLVLGLPKGKANSNYGNFNHFLLDQFERDLQVFGDWNVHKSYNQNRVIIPNSIGYIIEHIYGVKTSTFESSLPKSLFNLPKQLIGQFLRAFIDDEGHVYDSSIEYFSANKKLLQYILILNS